MSICVEPFAVTKKEAVRLLGSTALLKRMQYWSVPGRLPAGQEWLRVVREGGRGCKTLFDHESLKRAYARYRAGEEPPLLTSELRCVGRSKTEPRGGPIV